MHRHLLAVLAAAVIAAGCSSSEQTGVLTPEDRFARAKKLFDNGDYLEAINEFTVLTVQYQGSAVGADAQFYLAESRFERREYVLAAFEYGVLKRSYPASARVADAQFRLGLSYYEQAPEFQLDQTNTRKAIDEFQSFVEYYPAHPKAGEAEGYIRELTARLARKAFESAVLYARMEYYRAALLSFELVIEKYHDTEYAPRACLARTEILMIRGRWREAADEVAKFFRKYPTSEHREWGERLREQIDRELKRPKSDAPAAAPAPAPGNASGM